MTLAIAMLLSLGIPVFIGYLFSLRENHLNHPQYETVIELTYLKE